MIKERLEEYFENKTRKQLVKLVKEKQIAAKWVAPKIELVFLLVEFFERNPSEIQKLNIDSVVEHVLPFKIIPEGPYTDIKIDKNGFFCLEDIFSIPVYDNKSSPSKTWLRTKHFENFFDSLVKLTGLKEEVLIRRDGIGTTWVHPSIAINAAFFRSNTLGISFSGFLFDRLNTGTIVEKISLENNDITCHPLYKQMKTWIAKVNRLPEVKKRVVNYVVQLPANANEYKIYTALNYDEIEKEDGKIKIVIYHNGPDVARFYLARAISRRLQDFYTSCNRYTVKIKTIKDTINDIVKTCSFDVAIEIKEDEDLKLDRDKINNADFIIEESKD